MLMMNVIHVIPPLSFKVDDVLNEFAEPDVLEVLEYGGR